MAGRCDPGRPMHVDAHVVLARQRRLTGVQTDAHANRRPSRPFVGRELALRLHRRGDGARGGWKGDEEGVALGPDLAAGTARDGPPQDLAMGLEELWPLVATLFGEQGGALDVAEQEGDRTGGIARHLRGLDGTPAVSFPSAVTASSGRGLRAPRDGLL